MMEHTLGKHYKKGNESCIAMHDPLHRAGLVDSHIRDSGQVEWLVSITSKCGSVFSHFNWGKSYELLLLFSEEIEVKLYDPKAFNATRFANYVIGVYDRFTTVLDMTTQLLLSHLKVKSSASELLNKKHHVNFVMELCGV